MLVPRAMYCNMCYAVNSISHSYAKSFHTNVSILTLTVQEKVSSHALTHQMFTHIYICSRGPEFIVTVRCG